MRPTIRLVALHQLKNESTALSLERRRTMTHAWLFMVVFVASVSKVFGQVDSPDRCDAVLQHGIFNVQQYQENASYKRSLDTFFYHAEFRTHDEAIESGLSVGFPVYKVPLKIGATFDKETRESWKKEQMNMVNVNVSYETARSAAMSFADKTLIEGWVECIRLKGVERTLATGVTAGVRPLGERYVYFWIRYVSEITDFKPVIGSFQPTGVRFDAKTAPHKVGAPVPSGRDGLGGSYEVIDPQNVSFTVQIKGASSVAVPYSFRRVEKIAEEARGTIGQLGAFVVGEIRAFAFGADDGDKRIAKLRSQGWLECRGQSLNKLQYPELFEAIGYSWGSADKANVFNAPDLQGVFLRGWNHGSGKDPGAATRSALRPNGAEKDNVASYQTDVVGPHTHPLFFQYGMKVATNAVPNTGKGETWVTGGPDNAKLRAEVNAEGVVASETRPKNVYVMYAIFVGRPVVDDAKPVPTSDQDR
jgi:microcystin-dependent protein